MLDPEFYAEQLAALLPPGRLLAQRPDSKLRRLLLALAAPLARAHDRAEQLLVELYPPTTVELLEDWERLLGLPDPCTGPGQTLQERRARIIERLTLRPRATLVYLRALATLLGYPSADFTEGPGDYQLTVTVPTGRTTYFQTGESRCGELLGKFDQADDLACLLDENKPAHIEILFSYTGA